MTQPIEPVAWIVEGGGDSHLIRHSKHFPGVFAGAEYRKEPLYTASAIEAAKQEGRREGLEESRKLCEDKFMQRWADQLPREASTARSLADALTALIEKEKP